MNANDAADLKKYKQSISTFKRISKEREKELTQIIANSTGKAKDDAIKSLVEGNLYLVISIAAQRDYNGIGIMDLICEGNKALMRAANKYSCNHASKASFGTFAYQYISNAIIDVKQDKRKLIHLPKGFYYYYSLINDFENKVNRKATVEEISKLLKVSFCRAGRIQRALDIITVPIEELELLEDGAWEEIETHGSQDPAINRSLLRLDLLKFMKNLKPIQKKIIELIYLDDDLNYKEVGKQYGVSKQYIQIMCRKALRDIKVNLMRAWDKEHKIKTNVIRANMMDNLRLDAERAYNKKPHGRKVYWNLLKKEEKNNRSIYKKVLEHYLGERK